MSDIRLSAAWRLVWNKDAWREPAHCASVARALEAILSNEDESAETRTQAEVLLKKVYMAAKRPAFWTN